MTIIVLLFIPILCLINFFHVRNTLFDHQGQLLCQRIKLLFTADLFVMRDWLVLQKNKLSMYYYPDYLSKEIAFSIPKDNPKNIKISCMYLILMSVCICNWCKYTLKQNELMERWRCIFISFLCNFFFANIFFLVLLPQKMTEMIATAAHSMPKSKKTPTTILRYLADWL